MFMEIQVYIGREELHYNNYSPKKTMWTGCK